MTYAEKLKDPRWQKKRLEIMQRDEFTCMICGDTENTLNVHHFYYEKNKEPWDYSNDALITLCEDCHEYENNNRKIQEDLLLLTLRRRRLSSDVVLELARILNYTSLQLDFDVHLSMFDWWLSNDKNIKYMYDKYFKHIDKKLKAKNRIKK